jgi:hypothetical protein
MRKALASGQRTLRVLEERIFCRRLRPNQEDHLAALIAERVSVLRPEKVTTERGVTDTDATSAAFGLSAVPYNVEAKAEIGRRRVASVSDKHEAQFAIDLQDKVILPELQKCLRIVLVRHGKHASFFAFGDSHAYKFNRAKSESRGICRPMKNSPNSAYCALTSSKRIS